MGKPALEEVSLDASISARDDDAAVLAHCHSDRVFEGDLPPMEWPSQASRPVSDVYSVSQSSR
jgi:hypothetical protein